MQSLQSLCLPPCLNARGGGFDEETTNCLQQGRGQELLELAEQITIACRESSHSPPQQQEGSSTTDSTVDDAKAKSGMATCQALCHNHMCCVEQEEEYWIVPCMMDVWHRLMITFGKIYMMRECLIGEGQHILTTLAVIYLLHTTLISIHVDKYNIMIN